MFLILCGVYVKAIMSTSIQSKVSSALITDLTNANSSNIEIIKQLNNEIIMLNTNTTNLSNQISELKDIICDDRCIICDEINSYFEKTEFITDMEQTVAKWSERGISGLQIFNKIFLTEDSASPRLKAAIILLQQWSEMKSRSQVIRFDTKIFEGPYNVLINAVQKLIGKKKSIFDVSEECDIAYYENTHEISLFNDNDVIIMLAKPGDQYGHDNTRIVDVWCGIEETKLPKRSIETQTALYEQHLKAYNHIISIYNDDMDMTDHDLDSMIKKDYLGSFSRNPGGFCWFDVEKKDIEQMKDELSDAYEWNDQIRSIIGTVTITGKQFSASLNVKFDSKEWKIKGNAWRVAAFKTVEGKYSIYIATAEFEHHILKLNKFGYQPEGSILATAGITHGGLIKDENLEKYKTIMAKVISKRFAKDKFMKKPQKEDFV
eukprot:497444_1